MISRKALSGMPYSSLFYLLSEMVGDYQAERLRDLADNQNHYENENIPVYFPSEYLRMAIWQLQQCGSAESKADILERIIEELLQGIRQIDETIPF